jgi:Mrp family chromosome partitioning ATPase
MGKGIWEQAFNRKNATGTARASSQDSPGSDGEIDDLLFPEPPTSDRQTSQQPRGAWESAFSGRKAAAVPKVVADDARHQDDNVAPASTPEEPSVPPGPECAPGQPFLTAPHYRERSRSGPPLLDKLGDFLDKIWVAIHLEAGDRTPRTFLFCGATRQVGATFISFYLALSLALERSMKVLYVDAGLDKPDEQSIIPNIQGYPGLASYFAGYRSPESLILKTQYPNLSVLPSGAHDLLNQTPPGPQNPKTIHEFVAYCGDHFDATIFDGQPATEYPSTIAFAKAVDQTILVCKYGFSRREVVKLAIDKLKENGVAVAGAILNERQYPIPPGVYRILK